MPATQRTSYSFKDGLTMMAAKAVGIDPYMAAEAGENARAALNAIRNAQKTKHANDRAGYVREAQAELRAISPQQHPQLVNALNAKLLALQGRGGDTEIAHLTPGEVVLPSSMQTPQLMSQITEHAARQGIDPARLSVGSRANSVNPETGQREYALPPATNPIPSISNPGLELPDMKDIIAPFTHGLDKTHFELWFENGYWKQRPPGLSEDAALEDAYNYWLVFKDVLPRYGLPRKEDFEKIPQINFGGGSSLEADPVTGGPTPTDWSNRHDPFGVFRGYNNSGIQIGRNYLPYGQDLGFEARVHDLMRDAGLNPGNVSPQEEINFKLLLNAGAFDYGSPASQIGPIKLMERLGQGWTYTVIDGRKSLTSPDGRETINL